MKTIAVGEDSAVERKLIEIVLAHRPGFSLTLYNNGLELWHHVLEETPDLVIVDLLLTGLDGFSFCRLLRGHRRFQQSPPILAISSLTTPGTANSILEHGATRFLPKPFLPEDLLDAVTSLLAEDPVAS